MKTLTQSLTDLGTAMNGKAPTGNSVTGIVKSIGEDYTNTTFNSSTLVDVIGEFAHVQNSSITIAEGSSLGVALKGLGEAINNGATPTGTSISEILTSLGTTSTGTNVSGDGLTDLLDNIADNWQEPSPPLNKFVKGETALGITVDPSAQSSAALTTWLNSFDNQSFPTTIVDSSIDSFYIQVGNLSNESVSTPALKIRNPQSASGMIIFSPISVTTMVGEYLEGWQVYESGSSVAITTPQSFNASSSFTVGNVSESFETVNGYSLGAVKN